MMKMLVHDDENACSSWTEFSTITPNFKIDLAKPTNPGALSISKRNHTDLQLYFGATTTEANFSEYKIYYKQGIGEVSELDNVFDQNDDINLADINFNNIATTTINNLTASTTYSFAIFAYDIAGNMASSSVLIATTTGGGNPPIGSFNSLTQKSDASGIVDISIEVDDIDNDNTIKAQVEYEAGSSCDFTSTSSPTLLETTSSISADFGNPVIENDNDYQIGTSTGWILTSSGSNTINFDWDTKTDLPSANGFYCLKLTTNDGFNEQIAYATSTIYIDNIAPSSPGNLSINQAFTNSVSLNLGSQSSDINFDEYKIYYKIGDSGVSESDNVFDQNNDSNLAYIDYNGASTVTVNGLDSGATYTFKIWAYDEMGNSASSAGEITVMTNYTPDDAIDIKQKKETGENIDNGELIDVSNIELSATTTDLNSGETMSFYYELKENSESFTTSISEPASSCSNGTAYESCSSNIWKISTSTSVGQTPWYNPNWSYRKKITIDHNKVNSDETNFPVLIDITDSDLAQKARNDAYDIIFTTDHSTSLDYERDEWNNSTGHLTAWVEMNISSTTDTILYIYYGKSDESTDNANPSGVWDSNYKGVWHLNENPSGNNLDSTSNNNDLTTSGGISTSTGIIGDAINFTNDDNYLSNSSPSGYGTPGDYTISAWFKYSGKSGYTTIYNHNTYDPQFGMNDNIVMVYDGSLINSSGSTTYTDNQWHKVDYRRSGTTVYFYVDGELHGTNTHDTTFSSASTIYIGYSNSSGEGWPGLLDEVSYSETDRGENWIKTSFNNQNNPNTFSSLNSEEQYKYIYKEKVNITNIPDSNNGYKWQILACDDDGACSNWSKFNNTIPNFKVDAIGPSAPGNLSLNSLTKNSITLNFGTSTIDNNFNQYKIFYKEGTSGVNETDILHGSSTDSSLGFIDYNGNSTTTITGLSEGVNYTFNIWAYDTIGRSAKADTELVASTNDAPLAIFNSVIQKNDGSGGVDISIDVNDANNDNTRVKIEYVKGADCNFSSPNSPNLDIIDANATSTYEDAKIDNSNEYQIGNNSGWIDTSNGTNTIQFDWLSKNDEPNATNTVYCLRITANDLINSQEKPATSTVTIDNTSPTPAGNLSLNDRTINSLELNFGAEASDINFSHYKIFYVKGAGTVDESSNEHIDSNLAFIDYNGALNTTINGLDSDSQYSFKIYAYDNNGNASSSDQVSFDTDARPTGSFISTEEKKDGSGIVDISINVYDTNLDDVIAKIEYVAGANCNFSSPNKATLDESSANITATYGTPDINNTNDYQIGDTNKIITSNGQNQIDFDWDTLSDIPTADGEYCLRLTVNDTSNDQLISATSTLIIDNVYPSIPGSLNVLDVFGDNIELELGTSSSDTNFDTYKIFYKNGLSDVNENDLEYNKNDDPNLGLINYGGATSTVVSGLSPITDYVFNIWAYDSYGHTSSSTLEVSTTTGAIPLASWRGIEDLPDPTGTTTYIGKMDPIRMRISVANSGDWDFNKQYTVEYAHKNGTCADTNTWEKVATSSNQKDFQMADSIYLSYGGITTQRFSNTENYTYTPGKIAEYPYNFTPTSSLPYTYYTELEYAIQATASSTSGSTYCFRLICDDVVLDTYNQYPELTLAPTPYGEFATTSQRMDGSEIVDISIKVNDYDKDNLKARLEYAKGGNCDFTTSSQMTINPIDNEITATYGDPDVDNNSTYQLGTSTSMITTQYGTNTVEFKWDIATDLTNEEGDYCLRLTVNDGYDNQLISATTTIEIDQVPPSIPGSLQESDKTSNSVDLLFSTTTIDNYFDGYKIFYKQGSSGVTDGDTEFNKTNDINLGAINYNEVATTTITDLQTNAQYVFNIWAYDKYGHKTKANNEVIVLLKYGAKLSSDWQWFYDENNETPSSTPGLKATPSNISESSAIKLRMALEEIEGITGNNIKMRLQYSTDSSFASDVHFVGEKGATTTWIYSDGIDNDNDPISNLILSNTTIKASHNESGIATSSVIHPANTIAEWEFTIRNNGAASSTAYYFRPYNVNSNEIVEKKGTTTFPSLITEAGYINFIVDDMSVGSTTQNGLTVNASSTNTNISFGALPIGTGLIGAQQFTIDTNTGQGYHLYINQKQELMNDSGDIIAPVPYGNDSPAGWPTVFTDGYFGYHTSDATLSGSNTSRFAAPNTYAGFDWNMQEIGYSSIPVSNEVIELVLKMEIKNQQPAGKYIGEIEYILVPEF